jgi:hypothetical protein
MIVCAREDNSKYLRMREDFPVAVRPCATRRGGDGRSDYALSVGLKMGMVGGEVRSIGQRVAVFGDRGRGIEQLVARESRQVASLRLNCGDVEVVENCKCDEVGTKRRAKLFARRDGTCPFPSSLTLPAISPKVYSFRGGKCGRPYKIVENVVYLTVFERGHCGPSKPRAMLKTRWTNATAHGLNYRVSNLI